MRKFAAAFFVVCVSSVNLAAAGQESLPAGWSVGPVNGKLGNRAMVSVPEGYMFLDARATKAFLEQNQNIPDGDELGIILRVLPNDDYWFAVFSYQDTGHIDNSDRDSLDADGLMKSMLAGNRESNDERKKRGWSPLVLEGWHQPPFYDQATNNLTWATRLTSDGEPVINHSVRLLSRTGLMSAQLVGDANSIDTATQEFNQVLTGYSFNEGQRYAEFVSGDKIAGYGLTALIAGGAGAAAVKSGLLQKFWKLIVFAVLAIVGAVKKLFSSLFGKNEEPDAAPTAAPGN